MIQLILAANIVLVPIGEYLGEIPQVPICHFSYSEGTILTPGTRLNSVLEIEDYGLGSVVPADSGMFCESCKVPRIEMDSFGITTIFCE